MQKNRKEGTLIETHREREYGKEKDPRNGKEYDPRYVTGRISATGKEKILEEKRDGSKRWDEKVLRETFVHGHPRSELLAGRQQAFRDLERVRIFGFDRPQAWSPPEGGNGFPRFRAFPPDREGITITRFPPRRGRHNFLFSQFPSDSERSTFMACQRAACPPQYPRCLVADGELQCVASLCFVAPCPESQGCFYTMYENAGRRILCPRCTCPMPLGDPNFRPNGGNVISRLPASEGVSAGIRGLGENFPGLSSPSAQPLTSGGPIPVPQSSPFRCRDDECPRGSECMSIRGEEVCIPLGCPPPSVDCPEDCRIENRLNGACPRCSCPTATCRMQCRPRSRCEVVSGGQEVCVPSECPTPRCPDGCTVRPGMLGFFCPSCNCDRDGEPGSIACGIESCHGEERCAYAGGQGVCVPRGCPDPLCPDVCPVDFIRDANGCLRCLCNAGKLVYSSPI
ncbi:unnamed protein product [Darwinula stevensoni]|uniref:Uncharacterized protein n=1 Tax=Darwinula stevensoni TaxID=69355 RepID=A0A7R8ZZH0_9CRUS|nr:unnamed protein product [Darwinula stevensoni]CAG0882505.1 unnamed protein product [Darwinula stevensoni]